MHLSIPKVGAFAMVHFRELNTDTVRARNWGKVGITHTTTFWVDRYADNVPSLVNLIRFNASLSRI